MLGPAGALLARVGEVVLVTPRQERRLLDTLAARAGLRAVVVIDAPTYAGAAPSRADPGLLALAAQGVPVVVVRAGDDLRAALALAGSGAGEERVAHG